MFVRQCAHFCENLEDLKIKDIMTSKGLDQKERKKNEDQFQRSCNPRSPLISRHYFSTPPKKNNDRNLLAGLPPFPTTFKSQWKSMEIFKKIDIDIYHIYPSKDLQNHQISMELSNC